MQAYSYGGYFDEVEVKIEPMRGRILYQITT